jgi:hypothetical protein
LPKVGKSYPTLAISVQYNELASTAEQVRQIQKDDYFVSYWLADDQEIEKRYKNRNRSLYPPLMGQYTGTTTLDYEKRNSSNILFSLIRSFADFYFCRPMRILTALLNSSFDRGGTFATFRFSSTCSGFFCPMRGAMIAGLDLMICISLDIGSVTFP